MSHPRTRLSKVKILLLGGPGVGKTAFAVRYLTKRFIGDYDANKETTYSHKILLDRDEVVVDILDTANDSNEVVLEAHIRWADGFILMYSVTDKKSFDKLEYYQSLLHNYRRSEDGLPLVVVANKTDLNHARIVTEAEGIELAKRLGCPGYEISIAESPDGVTEAMDETLRQIKRDFLRLLTSSDKKSGSFLNVKRVFKRKITRSRSDTF